MEGSVTVKARSTIFVIAAVVALVFLCGGLLLSVNLLFGTEVLLPASVLPNDEDPILMGARARVTLGDERGQVLETLSDAWYHSECSYPDGSFDDLLFYGPRAPDESTIVLVRSQLKNGKTVVHFVGLVEDYMLHLYERCIPPPMKAFNMP